MIAVLLFSANGFLAGSLMFSYWLGRLAGHDIRQQADGNPGAVNAFRAGGWKLGVPALVLDYAKGLLPVLPAALLFGRTDPRMIPIALAPVLGHAFSPFLRFRGGKGVAVTFGIWTGLTLWQAPAVLGLALTLFKVVFRIRSDALSTLLGMVCLVGFIAIRQPSPVLLAIALANTLITASRHWRELTCGSGTAQP